MGAGQGYRERFQFPYGAFVTFTDSERECCIELTGETCQKLGHEAIYDFLAWALDHLAKVTRIDIRLDFKAKHVGLIDKVRESCMSKQLCRCKRFSNYDMYSSDGEMTGNTISLGKRGKNGSGRFVRIYDKGLETGKADAGKWERWETEFSKDAANQVAQQLLACEDWKKAACELALGAVEFREHTGFRSLKRRPLVAWWAKLIRDIKPILITIKHSSTTIERYAGWLCRCVFPTLQTMAKESKQPVSKVIDYFVGPDDLAKPLEQASPVVLQYLNELLEQINPNKQLA